MPFRLANVDGRAALVEGDDYHDVATASGGAMAPDLMACMARGPELHALAATLGDRAADGSLSDVRLGPPVPRPRNSFAVGLNYQSHADEADMEPPERPLVFTKFPSCIVGPDDDIELRCETGDYEAELVVVIGVGGRDIAAEDAWDHVLGVTVGQDISDRALQFAAKPPHFDLGKSRDTFGPIGPVLVSVDAVGDPTSLAITCDVNGERRQDGSTGQLIFDVPYLINYLSGITTLEPGDLIFTGTPDGIGATQGTFLAPGDVVTTTIQGIGTMTNRCT